MGQQVKPMELEFTWVGKVTRTKPEMRGGEYNQIFVYNWWCKRMDVSRENG